MGRMSEIAAKAELMLMGRVIYVTNEEVLFATQYILDVLHCTEKDYESLPKAKEVVDSLFKYDPEQKKYKVKYMTVNTVEDMVQIAYVIEEPEEGLAQCEWEVPDDVMHLAGCSYFSYIWNDTCPEYSQLGYTYYEKVRGIIRRRG